MSNYDLKIHSNPDAQAWAKFFIQTKEEKKLQIEDIDESLMIAWFANAMMAMHDHLKSQRKPLTDKRITQVIDSMPNKFAGFMIDWDLYEFTRAIEAAHGIKEKNT